VAYIENTQLSELFTSLTNHARTGHGFPQKLKGDQDPSAECMWQRLVAIDEYLQGIGLGWQDVALVIKA